MSGSKGRMVNELMLIISTISSVLASVAALATVLHGSAAVAGEGPIAAG